MGVKVLEEIELGSRKAIIPEVTGQAWYTGQNEFWFDPDDEIGKGFIFR